MSGAKGVVTLMFGNGWANILAAAIIAGAIIWSSGNQKAGRSLSEEEFAEIYTRAVGDIRNDIVVNCGCCGEGQLKRAEAPPF